MGIRACYALALSLPIATSACVSYRPDGSLVRRHFGYVTVVIPPRAGEAPVESLEISTYGIWLQPVLTAEATHQSFGIGYLHDQRDLIPADCRVVFRVSSEQQLDRVNTLFGEQLKKGDLCAIEEAASP